MSVGSVMIMAGGTGGHVYPGLAVAAVLAKRNVDVNWLGSANSFESKLIPTQHINFNAVNVGGLRGKGMMQKLAAPWMLTRSVIQALKIFRRIRPRAAISFGGFAAGPGGGLAGIHVRLAGNRLCSRLHPSQQRRCNALRRPGTHGFLLPQCRWG